MKRDKANNIVNCSYCDNEIRRWSYELKAYKHHYCSRSCQNKHKWEIHNEAIVRGQQEYRDNKKSKLRIIECVGCGCEIKTYYPDKKYCSRKCVSKYKVGELAPGWKGGVSSNNEKARKRLDYREWRTNVFKRDNYCCQHCGVNNNKLHAHHIKPFSKYPQLRVEISNGITLCQDCHKEEHNGC